MPIFRPYCRLIFLFFRYHRNWRAELKKTSHQKLVMCQLVCHKYFSFYIILFFGTWCRMKVKVTSLSSIHQMDIIFWYTVSSDLHYTGTVILFVALNSVIFGRIFLVNVKFQALFFYGILKVRLGSQQKKIKLPFFLWDFEG